MHNGCAFGRRQRAVFARPLYARAVKRINTLLTPRNRRSGLFPRVFFFLSSTPLVTYRCLRILLANLSTLCFARYIKARESSDALKNSTLPPPPFYRFRTALRVFICQRVNAANEISSPPSSFWMQPLCTDKFERCIMETFRTGSVTGCNGKNVTLPVARPQIDTPNSTRESIRNNQQQGGRGGGDRRVTVSIHYPRFQFHLYISPRRGGEREELTYYHNLTAGRCDESRGAIICIAPLSKIRVRRILGSFESSDEEG